MKILVIEDNPTDQRLAHATFLSDDHSVIQRRSAEQALRYLPTDRPEVILIDLRLPGMNGVEFVKQLRATHVGRDIPVVAITAFPDDFVRQKALAAGCDAYVVKPLDTRTLSSTLMKAARVRRPKPAKS